MYHVWPRIFVQRGPEIREAEGIEGKEYGEVGTTEVWGSVVVS